jgi:hypothetical protein
MRKRRMGTERQNAAERKEKEKLLPDTYVPFQLRRKGPREKKGKSEVPVPVRCP